MDTYDQILADISAILRQYNKTYPQITAQDAVERIAAIVAQSAYIKGYADAIKKALDNVHKHLDPVKNTEGDIKYEE